MILMADFGLYTSISRKVSTYVTREVGGISVSDE